MLLKKEFLCEAQFNLGPIHLQEECILFSGDLMSCRLSLMF